MKSKSGKAKPKKTVKPARRAVTKSARKTAMPKPKARKVVKSAAPARKAPPRATAPKPNLEQDRAEILAVSKMWWDANRKFSIPMMCEAFVGGEKFHGFNLNGHTYYGIDEWVRLWEHLGTVMAPVDEAAAAALSEPRDVRLEIRGDMACLSAESTFTIRVLPTTDAQSSMLPPPGEIASIPFRATEVFVREDHEGNPVWKMWHFHCSPHAPEGERRMGF